MAKITKTYYSRRRAGAYRRFYRRYTRRISRKMYNRVSLNYMRAKIEFNFSLEPNDNDQFKYTFREYGGANRDAAQIDVLNTLNDNDEYKIYNQLFNEVKLIGVGVSCIPYNSYSRNVNPVLFYGMYRSNGTLCTPIILNQTSNTNRYYKNWDRRWVPSDQGLQTQNAGDNISFYIRTASQSTIRKESSPCWSVKVTAYVQFRKNLTI